MIKSIVETCGPKTHVCVAANITTDQEKIMTKTVSEWKNKTPDFNKQPAVFLIQAS
jgi:16S rRNA (cytidine1402-2'-O)-methyltransferase